MDYKNECYKLIEKERDKSPEEYNNLSMKGNTFVPEVDPLFPPREWQRVGPGDWHVVPGFVDMLVLRSRRSCSYNGVSATTGRRRDAYNWC
ncbi:hypothetical protein ElyMa_006673300 [Elysia marginata]|uniref:Uncharacterized protein n=1 Tax=Elysia marginata TaxID=1093978 RepID=A0AAV4ISK9_9GAST|nr:hypothetical protein ElyMa_006673300 [Elysia marginata]